ncbi:DUF2589 domain-containing protein [Gynuella sp.]|uniref:DUF2589 domain-containing protein n=1 Tax=Gynuella sp. TaxID=2969146 RepID=UPI003D0D2E0B
MATQALNDLPLVKLISEPLHAAAQAHVELSQANLKLLGDFIKQGNQTFNFAKEDQDGTKQNIAVTVPTIALVDIPFFSIDQLTNEFTFEVSSIQEVSDEKTGTLSGSASSAGFLSKFVDIKLEAGYNTTHKATTSNSERGKLNITVTASKGSPSKGMQTIIDAAIDAISAK